jgi:hypothetical protein
MAQLSRAFKCLKPFDELLKLVGTCRDVQNLLTWLNLTVCEAGHAEIADDMQCLLIWSPKGKQLASFGQEQVKQGLGHLNDWSLSIASMRARKYTQISWVVPQSEYICAESFGPA